MKLTINHIERHNGLFKLHRVFLSILSTEVIFSISFKVVFRNLRTLWMVLMVSNISYHILSLPAVWCCISYVFFYTFNVSNTNQTRFKQFNIRLCPYFLQLSFVQLKRFWSLLTSAWWSIIATNIWWVPHSFPYHIFSFFLNVRQKFLTAKKSNVQCMLYRNVQ